MVSYFSFKKKVISYFKSFNNLDFKVLILEDNPNFRDDLGLESNSTRGAASLSSKFPRLSF